MAPVRITDPLMEASVAQVLDKRQRGLTFQGETLSIKAWAERLGWPVSMLYSRLREENRRPGSWPLEKLLTLAPCSRKKGRVFEVVENESATPVDVAPQVAQVVQLPATPVAAAPWTTGDFYREALPALRQHCRRLDEIEAAIASLEQERSQIIASLKGSAR
jgi:hypothetical protein